MESEEVVIDSVQSEVDSEVEEGIARLVANSMLGQGYGLWW